MTLWRVTTQVPGDHCSFSLRVAVAFAVSNEAIDRAGPSNVQWVRWAKNQLGQMFGAIVACHAFQTFVLDGGRVSIRGPDLLFPSSTIGKVLQWLLICSMCSPHHVS